MTVVTKFLWRPSPLAAALMNALVGLVLVPVAMLALYVLVLDVLEIPALPLRWLIGTSSIPFLFVAVLGLASGVATGAILFWAAWRSQTAIWRRLAANAAAFAICMPAALAASRFYWHGQTNVGKGAVIAIFAACGAAMAWTMARGVRASGATPGLAPEWIALLGAGLAALGVSATLFTPRLEPLEFLPAFWLPTVTYFCLKPLPQGPQTGL